MLKLIIKLMPFVLFSLVSQLPAFAAEPIDLSKEKISYLRSFMPGIGLTSSGHAGSDLKEVKKTIDFNQTEHIRLNQTYFGYPVWGAQAIVHVPNQDEEKKLSTLMSYSQSVKAKMNGVLYQNLQKDLQNTPRFIFTSEQAEKAINQAISDYAALGKSTDGAKNKESKLIVYIDDQNKAHWAFYVSFYIQGKVPSKPVYLLDAISLKPYEAWNEVKRLSNVDRLEDVKGGGFGGNPKLGKLIYDGMEGNLSKLDIKRDPIKKICYLANNSVSVTDYNHKGFVEFPCEKQDESHDNVYWSGAMHAVNGGYSPDNDALYAGKVVIDLYQSWYGMPVLTKDNKPMMLEFVTHSPNYDEYGEPDLDNALWDPQDQKMYFGDGETVFYPLTSVGVTAHEVSHGFTEQHSNLYYSKQSGALNEAFSDMAAQAAEFFVYNEKNSWKICSEITKAKDKALRYLDEPSKDCYNTRIPGERCSISKVKDYERYVRDHRYDSLPWTRYPNVHYSSGIYNRAFYLMATAPEWGTYKDSFKKAFNVMVKANQDYWPANASFQEGACGVLSAAEDYKYDKTPIKQAFSDVGIDTKDCK